MKLVFAPTATTACFSPVMVRIFNVISLPIFAVPTPETPRRVQSSRSASLRLAISAAAMTTMRRRSAVPGSGVASTRSPTATSAIWMASAFFKSFSPGAIFWATVADPIFKTSGAALSGLISISAVSALNADTVPTNDRVG